MSEPADSARAPAAEPTAGFWTPGRYARGVACAIALGVWLRWDTLEVPPGSDDYMQYAIQDGVYPSPRHPLDLFNFADGSPEDNQPLMDYGTVPWWTAPGLRLAMSRPLASALVHFDLRVLGEDSVLHHLHSLLWWVALVCVVAWLLFRVLPPGVAALTVAAFVCEEGHTIPIAWLANRGALVSLCFGLLGLVFHLRWREGGGARALSLSIVCHVLGLASGEWVFPAFAYLFAYELLERRDSLRVRALSLLPVGIPALAFLIVRGALSYGARNSGVYIDPLAEPIAFVQASALRVPVFVADLVYGVPSLRFSFGTPWRDEVLSWGLIPPALWARLPGYRFWHVALGVSAMVVLFGAWWRLTRAAGRAHHGAHAVPAWLWFGALLSMVPVLGSFPSSRLVMPASIGVLAVLSAVGLRLWAQTVAHYRDHRRRALLPFAGVAVLVYLHFYQACEESRAQLWFTSLHYQAVHEWIEYAELDDAELGDKRVVIVANSEHTLAFFLPFVLHHDGRPMPRSQWNLSGALLPHDLTRPARNVLELRPLGGQMLSNKMEQLYRDVAKWPMAAGDRVSLDGLTVDVLAVRGGLPTHVRYTFEEDLDSPTYLLLEAGAEGLRRFELPGVGGRRRLPRATFPFPGQMQAQHEARDPNVSCVGARRLIDDCVLGHAFADCGGDGAPLLGCHGGGDCRWFAGGCLAIDYVASACDVDTVCCQDGWPYLERDAFEHGPGAGKVAALLQGWGSTPWDGERAMNLDVFEAAQEPRLLPELGCAGPQPQGAGPCAVPRLRFAGAYAHSLSFAYGPPEGSAGWGLAVDVVDDPLRGPRARACRVWQPAVFEQRCRPVRPPECAIAGTLTLSALPAHGLEVTTAHGTLRARFADGGEVTARF